ncbi:MAG: ABC transporter permease [Bacteroidales bacterium]|nr:ABC transporter permease [Bacteroidales bacterium]MCF8403086.1 ABC transporter permease [Bacteroidales bacterium]
MIQKSIKIAIRRLVTLKAFSVINIAGMAIAVSVGLAILLYTSFHFSFDKYIPDGENSYRLITQYGDGTFSTNTFACFDDVLSDYPEVRVHTFCYDNHNIEDVFLGENKIKVKDALFVNDSFFDFFGVNMIRGNKSTINDPNTMMVTPTMAKKLFREKDAIGQTVLLRSFTHNQDSLISYIITGIVEPLPEASHIPYEMLVSQSGHFTPTAKAVKTRKVFGGLIYVKLYPSANIKALEESLQTKVEPILGGKHGPPLDVFNHKLQPVYDIHTSPGLNQEKQPTVRRSSLNILLMVGLLIFVIAILNSVIMHITRTTFNRTTNLIIRFHGGTKMNLFLQNLIDVFISVMISFLLSLFVLSTFKLFLAELFMTDWNISFNKLWFWILFFGLFVVVTVIISILSSLNLLQDLTIQKEANKQKGMKAAVPLVIFQFVMVIALIGFALLLNKQMNFIEKKDLGYDSENVVVIKIPQQNSKVGVFRNELLQIPGILNAGTARHYPGYHFQDMNFSSGDHAFPFKFGHIDQDAIETLNIKVLRYFTEAENEATEGWLINETFYEHLKSIYTDEQIATGNFPSDENAQAEDNLIDFKILGIIGDFHYASLHSEIENFAFFIPGPDSRIIRFVLARIHQNKSSQVITAMEHKLSQIYPGQPVNYSFLDEQLNRQYASEQLLMRLINAFSILAILIASMGLMGLSIFMTEKRSKEIGIRKVNGSSVSEIVQMLNTVFIKWVALAFIIATPIVYYAAQQWLQNFAYRTPISWWIFILAGIIALLIVMLTVSWQSFKVARRNPVEALRYE